MLNFRTPRLLAAAALAAFAGACTGDSPTNTVDLERTPDARAFASSHSGEAGVYLCKITFMSFDLADGIPAPYDPANDPTLGVTFNFDITGADVSSASLPAANWGALTESDCQLIYDGNATGSITIVETSPASVMNSVFRTDGFPKGSVNFLGVNWDGATRTVTLDPIPAGESWIVVKNTVTDTPPPDPLTVEKTASASYDRTVRWDLTKSVNPDAHSGVPGDAFQSIWTVTATKVEVSDNYQVTGNITVSNSNAFPVDFSLSDVLDDGTVAAITCPVTNDNTGTVAANGSVDCSYTASPSDASATANTVTVTSSVGGDTDTEGFTWVENLIGDDAVTLSDPRVNYEQLISSSTTLTPPEQFVCPTDLTVYVDGMWQEKYPNTAFLDGDNTDLEASAEVTVTCRVPDYEGCTPGYWRQSQHFGNWVGYATTDLFADVFGVAYPGTLLEAVWARGGGANALARHAVAALLNSTNGDVDSPYSTAQVIAAVQAAFATGDYDTAKNMFEAANELGCDLGRAELEDTSTAAEPGNKGKNNNKGRSGN